VSPLVGGPPEVLAVAGCGRSAYGLGERPRGRFVGSLGGGPIRVRRRQHRVGRILRASCRTRRWSPVVGGPPEVLAVAGCGRSAYGLGERPRGRLAGSLGGGPVRACRRSTGWVGAFGRPAGQHGGAASRGWPARELGSHLSQVARQKAGRSLLWAVRLRPRQAASRSVCRQPRRWPHKGPSPTAPGGSGPAGVLPDKTVVACRGWPVRRPGGRPMRALAAGFGRLGHGPVCRRTWQVALYGQRAGRRGGRLLWPARRNAPVGRDGSRPGSVDPSGVHGSRLRGACGHTRPGTVTARTAQAPPRPGPARPHAPPPRNPRRPRVDGDVLPDRRSRRGRPPC
jgi:hypothetical protein